MPVRLYLFKALLFSLLTTSLLASSEPNFIIELNRKMVNHMTKFLSTNTKQLNSVIFDIREDKLEMKIIFQKSEFEGLSWVKPTLRPGEIFKSASDRTGEVSKIDEKDFLVGIQLAFTLTTKPDQLDSVYLSFGQPLVAAFYEEDLNIYKKLMIRLGKLLAAFNGIKDQLAQIESEEADVSEDDVERQLQLTSKKAALHQKLQTVTKELDLVNRRVIRFSSGSHFSVLPSDIFIRDAINSVAGKVNGNAVLRDLYDKVKKMNFLNERLGIELVNNEIKNRTGTIRVHNVGHPLSGFVPGLKIQKVSVRKENTVEGAGPEVMGVQPGNSPRIENNIIRFEGIIKRKEVGR